MMAFVVSVPLQNELPLPPQNEIAKLEADRYVGCFAVGLIVYSFVYQLST